MLLDKAIEVFSWQQFEVQKQLLASELQLHTKIMKKQHGNYKESLLSYLVGSTAGETLM